MHFSNTTPGPQPLPPPSLPPYFPCLCPLHPAGDQQLFDASGPLLDVMGKAKFFLGEVGAGANMKLVVRGKGAWGWVATCAQLLTPLLLCRA